MRTADNGHLFLAQSTDSDKDSINADTSLSTVCGKRPFLFRVKKKPKTFSWQHVDVPSTTVHLIACCADYFYQTSYAENGFITEWRLSVSVDFVRGMTVLWRLELFNLTMLMFSFIPSVFCSYKRCFLFNLNNMILLIWTLSMVPSVSVLTRFDCMSSKSIPIILPPPPG